MCYCTLAATTRLDRDAFIAQFEATCARIHWSTTAPAAANPLHSAVLTPASCTAQEAQVLVVVHDKLYRWVETPGDRKYK